MKPTKKSEGLEQGLKKIFGTDRRETIISNKCTICGKQATEFKDELSVKEYRISGMCQECQDGFFRVRE